MRKNVSKESSGNDISRSKDKRQENVIISFSDPQKMEKFKRDITGSYSNAIDSLNLNELKSQAKSLDELNVPIRPNAYKIGNFHAVSVNVSTDFLKAIRKKQRELGIESIEADVDVVEYND